MHTIFTAVRTLDAGPLRLDVPVLSRLDSAALLFTLAAMVAVFRFHARPCRHRRRRCSGSYSPGYLPFSKASRSLAATPPRQTSALGQVESRAYRVAIFAPDGKLLPVVELQHRRGKAAA